MRSFSSAALFAVLSGLALTSAAQTTRPANLVDVFTAAQDGYHTFRIPSLLLTPKGTLLAFAEGRKSGARDSGPIELVMKHSSDGGATWGPLKVISADPPNTVGNPCAVVDRDTGTIFVLHGRNLGSDTESAILGGKSKGTRTTWITSSA